MAKDVEVSWRYSETNSNFDKLGDVGFYKSLPGMKEYMRTTDGRIPGGSPDANQIIFWGGTAILSSSVLAAAIKAYVTLKKRKIVITVGGGNKKLEYEGPNLEQDQKVIEEMIDKLSDEAETLSITIYAERRN